MFQLEGKHLNAYLMTKIRESSTQTARQWKIEMLLWLELAHESTIRTKNKNVEKKNFKCRERKVLTRIEPTLQERC